MTEPVKPLTGVIVRVEVALDVGLFVRYNFAAENMSEEDSGFSETFESYASKKISVKR